MGSQHWWGLEIQKTPAKNTSKTPLKSQSPVILRVFFEHARLISAIAILVFGSVFGTGDFDGLSHRPAWRLRSFCGFAVVKTYMVSSCLEVFMVDNLFFGWPTPLFFMVLGGSWYIMSWHQRVK